MWSLKTSIFRDEVSKTVKYIVYRVNQALRTGRRRQKSNSGRKKKKRSKVKERKKERKKDKESDENKDRKQEGKRRDNKNRAPFPKLTTTTKRQRVGYSNRFWPVGR